MTAYTPLAPGGGTSPPLEPSYRPSEDVASSELRPMNSDESYSRPRSPYSQQSPAYDSYSYNSYTNNSDLEGKGLVSEVVYKSYKRRYFGLAELTLLNFAIGWGNAAPGVVSTTATEWYGISYSMLNNLSIASSLVFLVPAPFVIWVLNKHGPKMSIIIACALTVIGNWIIFAAATQHSFVGNVAGTIVSSLASPFVQAAPTRYSRQWFGDRSRTFATALQALAYPLGGGFGALTGPYMVKPVGTLDYAGQALVIAIVFTAVAIPAPFIPKEPPTPPSAVAAAQRLRVKDSIKSLLRNRPFWVQFLNFGILAGSIDTLTSVTNQGIVSYGYTQKDAGYALAILIFVGVVAAIIVSPVLDRTKKHVVGLKIFIVLIAATLTALPFIPQTRSVPALFLIFGLLGAATLSVEPCVLEIQATWTHPVSPEFSGFICWSGAKVLAALFTYLVGNALVLDEPKYGQPAKSLFLGFIFVAIMSWLTVPGSLLMGYWIFKKPEASNVEGND